MSTKTKIPKFKNFKTEDVEKVINDLIEFIVLDGNIIQIINEKFIEKSLNFSIKGSKHKSTKPKDDKPAGYPNTPASIFLTFSKYARNNKKLDVFDSIKMGNADEFDSAVTSKIGSIWSIINFEICNYDIDNKKIETILKELVASYDGKNDTEVTKTLQKISNTFYDIIEKEKTLVKDVYVNNRMYQVYKAKNRRMNPVFKLTKKQFDDKMDTLLVDFDQVEKRKAGFEKEFNAVFDKATKFDVVTDKKEIKLKSTGLDLIGLYFFAALTEAISQKEFNTKIQENEEFRLYYGKKKSKKPNQGGSTFASLLKSNGGKAPVGKKVAKDVAEEDNDVPEDEEVEAEAEEKIVKKSEKIEKEEEQGSKKGTFKKFFPKKK